MSDQRMTDEQIGEMLEYMSEKDLWDCRCLPNPESTSIIDACAHCRAQHAITQLRDDLKAERERADRLHENRMDSLSQWYQVAEIITERDTLAEKLRTTTEAMHTASQKIQDRSAHQAYGVLMDTLVKLGGQHQPGVAQGHASRSDRTAGAS